MSSCSTKDSEVGDRRADAAPPVGTPRIAERRHDRPLGVRAPATEEVNLHRRCQQFGSSPSSQRFPCLQRPRARRSRHPPICVQAWVNAFASRRARRPGHWTAASTVGSNGVRSLAAQRGDDAADIEPRLQVRRDAAVAFHGPLASVVAPPEPVPDRLRSRRAASADRPCRREYSGPDRSTGGPESAPRSRASAASAPGHSSATRRTD